MNELVKWEYRVQTMGSTFSSPKDADLEAGLNEWGEEGWEVISITPFEGSNKIRVTARRPLSAAARRRRAWTG